ncbi:MAG: hypothetical protein NTY04_00285 [Candidatus Staskawiczbacteria bacterium]|nr:hypothetical protein [Candidatus Staskawiczbacteria bacterium]
MFIAIIFIAIGLAMVLNAMGLLTGSFWGIFWGIIFLAVGCKMIIKKNGCPMCGWGVMHKKMHDNCECDCDHQE